MVHDGTRYLPFWIGIAGDASVLTYGFVFVPNVIRS